MPRSPGITTLQILGAIRSGASYGLDIVTHTGLPSGTVYPTLARLKERGAVTARWEDSRIAERDGRPRRRYYALTDAGERILAKGLSSMRAVARQLAPPPPGWLTPDEVGEG